MEELETLRTFGGNVKLCSRFEKVWQVLKKNLLRTSLVVQWLRIRLPVQGTWVRALVREHPTCRGATKPVCYNYRACSLEPMSHNCWACALEPVSHNYWACVSQLLKPMCLEPCSATAEATAMRSLCTAMKSSACLLQLEKKPTRSNKDPAQPKIN